MRPNVLLISVDTLRADRLSLYGYPRDTSPNLRRLARDGVVFKRALSPGTWTLPGHAAMLTGLFPGRLGALDIGATLPEDAVTLAERLREAGYRTGAVVANVSVLDRGVGWSQGFDFYDDTPRQRLRYTTSLQLALWSLPKPYARLTSRARTADAINAVALEWLATDRRTPFFLFINYMDTHHPYMPPDEYLDRFPGRRTVVIDPLPDLTRRPRGLTQRETEHYRALYDASIAYVDHEIGRLLGTLAVAGRLEDTLVIVTSDHGEFFGEHGLFQHAVGPYEEVHRVPLVIRYPGRRRHGVVDGWVQLVDVFPSVRPTRDWPRFPDPAARAIPPSTTAIGSSSATTRAAARSTT
jgi:arylsulfatase A-like enzyme